VLVTATLVREIEKRWLQRSLALHVLLMLTVIAGTILAGRFVLPSGVDPFGRTLGWREMAAATRNELQAARQAGKPFSEVLTDDRALTAELLYYMRDETTPIVAWRSPGRPKDHYELSRPFTGNVEGPVLLVSLDQTPDEVTRHFATVTKIETRPVKAGAGKPRKITFFALEGYARK